MTVGQASHPLRELALAGLVASSVCANAAAPRYSCQRLDGADLHGQHTYAQAINSHGDVAGTGQFSRHEALLTAGHWKSDGTVDYLVRSHRESGAYGINEAGQIVGFVTLNDAGTRPTVWTDGEPSLLPTLAGRKGAGVATSINNQGQIVGASTMRWTGEWRWRATLWDHGKATNLGSLDKDFGSRALAISDQGVVVGFSDLPGNGRRAVQWSAGAMTDLGTLPGGTWSEAVDVSPVGVVVGNSNTADNAYYQHAVAWRDGQIVDLGTLPGDLESYAEAIGPDGIVTGHSGRGFGPGAAVIWFGLDQAPVDLSTLIADGGCRDADGRIRMLSSASGISANGAIAVTSYTAGPKGYVQAMAFKLLPL